LAGQVTGENAKNPLSEYAGKLAADTPAAWTTAQDYLTRGGAAVTPEQIQASMNPFTAQILAPQLAKLREQYDIQGRDLEGSAARLNAFGGDRYALEKDLINRRKDSAVNELTASSMKTAYDEAMKLSQDNRTAALQAGGAYSTLGSGQLAQEQANLKSAYDEFTRMQQGNLGWLTTQGTVLGGMRIGQTTEGSTSQQGTNATQSQNSSSANTFGVTDTTGSNQASNTASSTSNAHTSGVTDTTGTNTTTGTNYANGTNTTTGTNYSDGTNTNTGTSYANGTNSATGTNYANGTNTATGTNYANGNNTNTGTNYADGTTGTTGTTSDTGTLSQTGTQTGSTTSDQTLTGPDPNMLGAISNVLVAGVNMANAPKTPKTILPATVFAIPEVTGAPAG